MDTNVEKILMYSLVFLFLVGTFPMMQNVVLNTNMDTWTFAGADFVASILTQWPLIYISVGVVVILYFAFHGGS